jgi:hypothetical protein
LAALCDVLAVRDVFVFRGRGRSSDIAFRERPRFSASAQRGLLGRDTANKAGNSASSNHHEFATRNYDVSTTLWDHVIQHGAAMTVYCRKSANRLPSDNEQKMKDRFRVQSKLGRASDEPRWKVEEGEG